MITQDQVLSKVIGDLNALVLTLGFKDTKGNPFYVFYGEVATYESYNFIKSLESVGTDEKLKYVPIIPVALIRDDSTPSAGETINERLDRYQLFCYIKDTAKDDMRLLFETYMANENMVNNLSELDGTTILKNFSNFIIDNEAMVGAPDGESRHQVSLKFSYDLFESSLTTSKDYKLLIDGKEIKYLSWRFEKANMFISNSANTTTGKDLNNTNKLHEITLHCELYIDKTNTVITKLLNNIYSTTKTNVSYKVQLQKNGVDVFNLEMIQNGGKTTDTPPQINTIQVTFALSYKRIGISSGILGNVDTDGNQVYEDLPIYSYKFGHAASLYTAAYMGDNASKSTVVGLAKGLVLVVPVLTSGSVVMNEFIKEALGKIYTKKYIFKFTFLSLSYTYIMILKDTIVGSDDAAYDSLSLSFEEAK